MSPQVIDQRIQTTAFNAEQALTKDTVPVNVDAIIFWRVHDAENAALEITDYPPGHRPGGADLAARDHRRLDADAAALRAQGRRRAAARRDRAQDRQHWGVAVISVEIRDVAIPVALQDAMSRQAQAEREKQARVILGSAEAEVAAKFVEAARTYGDDPMAFQLRAMNIIYETTKERGATILIPSAMVDAMNPSIALALALAARRRQSQPRPAPRTPPSAAAPTGARSA